MTKDNNKNIHRNMHVISHLSMIMQRKYSIKAQNQRSDIRDSISVDRYNV